MSAFCRLALLLGLTPPLRGGSGAEVRSPAEVEGEAAVEGGREVEAIASGALMRTRLQNT